MRTTLLVVAAALAGGGAAAAQEPDTAAAGPEAGVDARLEGVVLLGDEPVDTATVVLHRVGPDTAGTMDSVRVDPEGRFTLRLPSVPDPETRSEVYFASVRRGGILYFGGAVTEAPRPDSVYRIRVYDTRVAASDEPALSVAHRNLFVEPGEEAWRVTDLIEMRNEGDVTLVAPPEGATWEYPLPEGASDLVVGEQDLAPDALTLSEGGTLRIGAAISPGERLWVVRYTVPPPPIRIPLPHATEVVELLIEEPAPPLRVEALEATDPVELQPGSTYRRFAGSDVGPGTVVVELAEEAGGVPPRTWGVVLSLLLGLAGLLAYYRPWERGGGDAAGGSREAAAPGAPDPVDERRRILVELAELDEAHDRRPDPTPAEERAYRARRRELLERLDPPSGG